MCIMGPYIFKNSTKNARNIFVQCDIGFVIMTLRTSVLTLMRISFELYLSEMFIIF